MIVGMGERATRSVKWVARLLYRLVAFALFLVSLAGVIYGIGQVGSAVGKAGWARIEGTVVGVEVRSGTFLGFPVHAVGGAVIESSGGVLYVVDSLESEEIASSVTIYADPDSNGFDTVRFVADRAQVREWDLHITGQAAQGSSTPWFWHAVGAAVGIMLAAFSIELGRRLIEAAKNLRRRDSSVASAIRVPLSDME